jgi:hypothetical protein
MPGAVVLVNEDKAFAPVALVSATNRAARTFNAQVSRAVSLGTPQQRESQDGHCLSGWGAQIRILQGAGTRIQGPSRQCRAEPIARNLSGTCQNLRPCGSARSGARGAPGHGRRRGCPRSGQARPYENGCRGPTIAAAANRYELSAMPPAHAAHLGTAGRRRPYPLPVLRTGGWARGRALPEPCRPAQAPARQRQPVPRAKQPPATPAALNQG